MLPVNCTKVLLQSQMENIQPMIFFQTVFGKKLAKPILWIILFSLLSYSASAANWFIRPTSAGSNSGANWNNAWAMTNITWTSVSAGDTLWIGGGTYYSTNGFTLSDTTKSGTSGAWINILRATTNDAAATSAAGWQTSFNTNVVIEDNSTLAAYAPSADIGIHGQSFINIDGRGNMQLMINNNQYANHTPSGIYLCGLNVSNVVIANLQIIGGYTYTNDAGMNTGFGNGISMYPDGGIGAGSSITFVTITNCEVRGMFTGVEWGNYLDTTRPCYAITIDHCKFHNIGGTASQHSDLLYCNMSGPFVVRYCEFYDWSSMCIYLFPTVTGQTNLYPFYVYGNVFHDPVTDSGFNAVVMENQGNFATASVGPVYFFNNTIYNCPYYTVVLNAAPASMFFNNIWIASAGFEGYDSLGTWNFNYANNNILSAVEPNGINNSAVNPLIKPGVGGNFMIVSNIGAAYPRNKGTVIPNPVDPILGTIDFSKDPNGNTRGADGAWNIGAYEYVSGVVVEPIISNIYSIPIPLSTNSVKIAWTTDENANSIVDYGITTSYGSSITNSSMVTFHEITITNLNTQISTYFQIRSIDSQNRMNFRTDNIPTSQSFL